jgi:hypothetical protein
MLARAIALSLLLQLPSSPHRSVFQAPPENVLIARDTTEPSVAVDPRSGSTIVVSTNTNYDRPVGGTFPTGAYFSRDGGRSFTGLSAPQAWPYTTGADTSVSIDSHGTVFYAYLGETPAYCSGGRSAVVVTHSIDGGRSYRPARVIDANAEDDKPFLGVESEKSGPSHLFLTWTRFHDSPSSSDVWLSRSTDGGVHFSSPVPLFASGNDNVGSVPVIGPHGRVYVFWMSYPDATDSSSTTGSVLVRVSTDDGAHFGPARAVAGGFTRLPFMLGQGSLRVLSSPAATVARDGTAFVAWAQMGTRRSGGAVTSDIMLARSRDGGVHWSSPVRVNDARSGDRFMPAVASLPGGSVGVAFYDRRRGPGQLDVYAARVHFGAQATVSSNVRVTSGNAPVAAIQYLPPGSTCFLPGRFFGDYIGVAGDRSGHFCVAWADTQLHIANETDVWFARVSFGA